MAFSLHASLLKSSCQLTHLSMLLLLLLQACLQLISSAQSLRQLLCRVLQHSLQLRTCCCKVLNPLVQAANSGCMLCRSALCCSQLGPQLFAPSLPLLSTPRRLLTCHVRPARGCCSGCCRRAQQGDCKIIGNVAPQRAKMATLKVEYMCTVSAFCLLSRQAVDQQQVSPSGLEGTAAGDAFWRATMRRTSASSTTTVACREGSSVPSSAAACAVLVGWRVVLVLPLLLSGLAAPGLPTPRSMSCAWMRSRPASCCVNRYTMPTRASRLLAGSPPGARDGCRLAGQLSVSTLPAPKARLELRSRTLSCTEW